MKTLLKLSLRFCLYDVIAFFITLQRHSKTLSRIRPMPVPDGSLWPWLVPKRPVEGGWSTLPLANVEAGNEMMNGDQHIIPALI